MVYVAVAGECAECSLAGCGVVDLAGDAVAYAAGDAYYVSAAGGSGVE